jgi:hypothetical protein
MQVSFFTCSLTLTMVATYFSETSLDFQRITRRDIPEDKTSHNLQGSLMIEKLFLRNPTLRI